MDHINTQRYCDCLKLYLEHRGKNIKQIEREMRALGHLDFHRRILYSRSERGVRKPGWIEKFGWRRFVDAPGSEPPAPAGGQFPALSEPPASAGAGQNLSAAATNLPPANAGGSDSSFLCWLKSVSPNMNWDWRHIRYITAKLKAVTDGTCKRLMIFLPPRHGKSELVTVRYTSWRLTQNPTMNVILAGYNQQLANRFSRKIKHALFDAAALHEAETRPVGSVPAHAAPEPTKRCSNCRSTGGEGTSKHSDACSCEQDPRSQIQNPKSEIPYLPANASRPRRINSAAEWDTNAGGSLRAVGVGGGVTGFGADLIVIDDPVKSRAEAESETRRRRLWEWYRDDIQTRLEPNGAVILIQTRWHEHDLAGRLLEEMESGGDQWEVINLPALSEPPASAGGQVAGADTTSGSHGKPEGIELTAAANVVAGALNWPPADAGGSDPLGRPPGAALCPERFDEAKLADIQRQLGSYAFSALYQQRPTPADGGIFKREWFKRFVAAPPTNLKWKRGYDLAVSTKTAASYTASFRCAFDTDGSLYIDGGFRARIEYPDQRRFIIERILAEPTTEHGIELALHGQAIIQDLRREPRIRAHLLRGVAVEDDKITRSLTWAPLAEEGKLVLVKGPWNEAFIEEACGFPAGAFDDQIDAVSLAVEMLKTKPRKAYSF
jgi:predicted phage terminase large subunit-like protein